MSGKEEKHELLGIIGASLASAGDSLFGVYLGLALVFVGIAFTMVAVKWDGHIYDRTGCIELQEAKGSLYKVDTCTGTIETFKESGIIDKK